MPEMTRKISHENVFLMEKYEKSNHEVWGDKKRFQSSKEKTALWKTGNSKCLKQYSFVFFLH